MDADLRKKLKTTQNIFKSQLIILTIPIEGFAYKLDKIIEEEDNKDIWL